MNFFLSNRFFEYLIVIILINNPLLKAIITHLNSAHPGNNIKYNKNKLKLKENQKTRVAKMNLLKIRIQDVALDFKFYTFGSNISFNKI